ncbi:Membrane protein involved in the export of O-antigen and teichoic acid [Maribacter aquivivus]|uniref:Membrane protein involved in the export of O-antigen and teichoic acid n=1 Tax=Maribacter aquivivus TaxID=228958 RepID=A0A1M6LHT2_9FLAO|nr:MATE family efflux transporter [Maribacter aquivivus]SHJ70744.1 Membrane protein involved in the export of O-antigen and teichoic acid [Maribacter aquivivus]
MRKLINFFLNKINSSSDRTKNIIKHIGWSSLFKAGSVLISFLLVPLTITYLNNENYGIWLTLSSFISWFTFLDVGLGKGLQNKFAEAKANKEYDLAKAYVSCAYFTIGIVSLILVFIFFILNKYINWAQVFNANDSLNDSLNILLPIIFTFFGFQLVSKLIVSIYIADQHHSINIKIEFFTRVFSLLAVWILIKTTESSLLIYGCILSILPFLVLLVLNLIGFKGEYRHFKPVLSLWKRKYLKDITGVGLNFFVIQISTLILFSTDNFIIAKLFTAADVVPYNVAFKYFSIMVMLFTIIVTPYWSSITEAYTNNDFLWIKNSIKRLQILWFAVPICLLVMLALSNWFYNFWVGDKVNVEFNLSFSMAIFAMLMTFNMIYVNFINGVGKIKLQLYLGIFSMIINIPLSIFFSKILQLGLSGVVLATCFSLLLQSILSPIQYFKIINGKAKGIWNK